MNAVTSAAARWSISARSTGEVLVVRSEDAEVGILVYGAAQHVQATPSDLDRILAAARDAGPAAEGGAVPVLMQRIVSRLLAAPFMAGESGALVVHDNSRQVTAAIAGHAAAQVLIDGRAVTLPWVKLRDRAGREARAFPLPQEDEVRVVVSWPADRKDTLTPGIVLEAVWNPVRVATAPSAAPSPVPAQAPAATSAEVSGTGFFQWLDRMIDNRGVEGGAPTPSDSQSDAPLEQLDTQRSTFEIERTTPEPVSRATEARLESPPTAEPPARAIAAPPPAQVAPAAPVAHARNVAPHAIVQPSLAAPVDAAPPVEPPDEVVVTQTAYDAIASTPAPPAASPTSAPDEYAKPFLEPLDAPPSRLKRRTPMRPAWLEEEEAVPLWRRPWTWGLLLVAVLCGAVMVTTVGKLGLPSLGPHFTVLVNSRPPGAVITIDGKETARVTPASIDLPAGEHTVTLSLPGLGAVEQRVQGEGRANVALDVPLYGSVRIGSSDSRMPINVTLDGVDRGDTPVVVDDLVPGTHEVRYLAPGTDPWTDTFQARIGETVELVAQPFSMPETGVIEVRATVLGPEGNEPVKGAAIFVDGELRGSTPAEIELPRGPHSIRLTWKGSDVPVQVIDLPGGNHRYADFSFGTDVDAPRLTQVAPGAIGRDQPSVAAAAIRGIAEAELREMWLHVRSPEGAWKRYPMTLMRAPAGIVGVAVFPSTMLAESGDTPYYMSAMSQVGDEYFTEVRKARSRGSAPKSESRSRGSRSSAAPSTSSTPSAEATTP